jgi:FAD/FMN-containing dehydrogenase
MPDCILATPPRSPLARDLNDRLVARALAMDGTCTGEHGIGLGKQDKLVDELGEATVAVMQLVIPVRSARRRRHTNALNP